MTCTVGDWVTFYQDCRLVIGAVMYRREVGCHGHIELCTTIGAVDEKDVIECRKGNA